MVQNKGFILKKIPKGWPVAGEDLVVEDRPFDLDTATPPPKGILIKNYYFSFDPYQRGRMRDPSIKSYSAAYPVGQPITNRSVSKVIKSDNPKFKPGDVIVAADVTPMEEYSQMGESFVENARLLDNPYKLDPKVYVGALGMPGLTAYSSFYDIGQPKEGETIFISAASGAVGQIVGQLAKREGLKVIGSVGDDKKLDFIVNELGFDSGFNYKKEKPAEALARLAPDGIDIYYENVGGEQLEAALNALKLFGRIVACGMISQYNTDPKDVYPIRNLMQVVGKRLTMRGFIVGDANMGKKYFLEHQKNVAKWIADGSLKIKMSETKGIDNAPEGFIGMLRGDNFGKAVLVVDELES